MTVEDDLMRLILFLSAVHLATIISPLLGQSPIPLHIIIGALLGPPLASFAPFPTALSLAGILGLYLSVLHAGLQTDFATVRRDILRAFTIATIGLAIPFGLSVVVVYVWHGITPSDAPWLSKKSGTTTLLAALAAGAAIAPTSLGVVARLLETERSRAATRLGTLVALAAVIDDVEALVLLAEVQALARESQTAWTFIRPLLVSLGCVVGATLFATILPAGALEKLAHVADITRKPGFHLGLVVVMGVATATTFGATRAGSSGVLAAYVTGLAFARRRDPVVLEVWDASVTPIENMLSALFFAATIGFVVPLKVLVQPRALAAGSALAGVAVIGKLACGLGMAPRWADGVAVGAAMLGRGEFGFLIGAAAHADGLLSETEFAAVTWGVLVPTLMAPVVFKMVFRWRARKEGGDDADEGS